jgi:hypothetical protein
MKTYIKSTLLVASFAFVVSGCYYDTVEDLHPAPIIIPGVNDNAGGCDTTKAITYTADIKPILDASCGTSSPCHSSSSPTSGIDLSSYTATKNASATLIDAVTWGDGISNMPKGSTSKINDCSIAKIKKWVNTGTAE